MTSMHFAVLLLFPLLLEAMQVPDNAGRHPLREPRGLPPPPLEPPLLQPLCSLNGSGNFGDVPFPRVTVLPTLERLLEEFPLASMTCSVAWKSTWCLLQFADPSVLFELHAPLEWRNFVKTAGAPTWVHWRRCRRMCSSSAWQGSDPYEARQARPVDFYGQQEVGSVCAL